MASLTLADDLGSLGVYAWPPVVHGQGIMHLSNTCMPQGYMGVHYVLLPQVNWRHIHPSNNIAKSELRYFYLQLLPMCSIYLCHPVDSAGNFRVFWLYTTEEVVN